MIEWGFLVPDGTKREACPIKVKDMIAKKAIEERRKQDEALEAM